MKVVLPQSEKAQARQDDVMQREDSKGYIFRRSRFHLVKSFSLIFEVLSSLLTENVLKGNDLSLHNLVNNVFLFLKGALTGEISPATTHLKATS